MAPTKNPAFVIYEHEEKEEFYVLVRVVIPKLKCKRQGCMSCINCGGRTELAKNAEIECEFEERSFTLTVTGDSSKKMKNKKWSLSRNLPHPIDTEGSYWQVGDGSVYVFLKKADEEANWSIIHTADF